MNKLFSKYKKVIIDNLAQLVECKTVNPPGNEYLVGPIIKKCFKNLNVNKTKIIGGRKRTNYLGYLGSGHGPVMGIFIHSDVVPVGSGWRTNPFKTVIKNNRIYGRGVLDNKGCFSIMYGVLKSFIDAGIEIPGTIIFGMLADEERGSNYGIKTVLNNKINMDYCFIPDGGDINNVVIGEKGAIWIELECIGKQAHGSLPVLGRNAIEKLYEFISLIKKDKFWKKCNKDFTGTTINLGRLTGGSDTSNMVPAFASASLDIRYPKPISSEDIMKFFKNKIKSYSKKNKVKLKLLKPIYVSEPHILKKNSRLIQCFKTAGKKKKHKLNFITVGGNTVAKLLVDKNIPCIVHSPDDEDSVAHKANEYIKIKNIESCFYLWRDFITEFFGI